MPNKLPVPSWAVLVIAFLSALAIGTMVTLGVGLASDDDETSERLSDSDEAHRLSTEPTESNDDSPEPGSISVNSKGGATVTIDGDKVGRTPIIRHPVPPGDHEVVANFRGSPTMTRTVHVRSRHNSNVFFEHHPNVPSELLAAKGDEVSETRGAKDDELRDLLKKARRASMMGDQQTAIKLAMEARDGGDDSQAGRILAIAYERLGDKPKAVIYYNEWLEKNCSAKIAPLVRRKILAAGGTPTC